MSSDVTHLICGIVGDPMVDEVAGSEHGYYCSLCATEICMSPSMATYWREHPNAVPICTRCSISLVEGDDAAEIMPVPGSGASQADTDAVRRGLAWYYRHEGA
jgi:hypothetical protein